MKLYADHIENASVEKAAYAAGLDALARVLPRRCPGFKHLNGEWYLCQANDGASPCGGCDGRGFLYPEAPDWWDMIEHDGDLLNNWERHCARTWQAMGITD